MKFVLFVEGYTEDKAVPKFLKRWLDPKLPSPAGIKTVRFEGWPQLVKDAPAKARLPETVNSTEPPAKLLERLYPIHTRRSYKKVVTGKELFDKLNPELALSTMSEAEIVIGQNAGIGTKRTGNLRVASSACVCGQKIKRGCYGDSLRGICRSRHVNRLRPASQR